MPIIQVNLRAGRPAQTKAALAAEITAAVCRALDAKPESVRVLFREYAEDEWYVAGKPLPAVKHSP